MADAIVSAVLEPLVSVVDQQIKLFNGVDDEVKKLTSNLQTLKALIVDADRKQVTEAKERVWLEKLKRVSYQMDNDEWNTRVQENPESALESDHGGNTALHLASDQGNLAMVRLLVKRYPELCLVKNIYERTPMHMAVMRGRVGVAFELLKACPESIMVVSATEETPLHVAIRQWQENFLELLIESIQKRSDYVHLINKKDCAGNTVLHLAIARKQFQVIRLLLSQGPSCNGKVDVNAMNYGGFTALDILDVLPQEGKRDVDIEMILQREGAMRARDLGKVILLDDAKWNESQITGDRSSHLQHTWYWPTKAKCKTRRAVLLITAAFFFTISFLAVLKAPGGIYKSSTSLEFQVGKQSSNYLLRLFIWFDSIAFIASASMIITIMHEIPFKPLTIISVLSMYGAYICLIKVVSPRDALPVFLLGSPLILLASMSKHLALHSTLLKHFNWHGSEFIKAKTIRSRKASSFDSLSLPAFFPYLSM